MRLMNEYYYLDQANQKQGPLPIESLRGVITQQTLVWTSGMANWTPASQVAELAQLFAGPAVPPSPQQPPQHPYGYQQPQPQQPQPGYYGAQPNNGQVRPDNYLVWAILSTILCCLPLGVVSIVYSCKVNGLYETGRYQEANEAADNAKKFAIASAACGLVGAIIGFFMGLAGAL